MNKQVFYNRAQAKFTIILLVIFISAFTILAVLGYASIIMPLVWTAVFLLMMARYYVPYAIIDDKNISVKPTLFGQTVVIAISSIDEIKKQKNSYVVYRNNRSSVSSQKITIYTRGLQANDRQLLTSILDDLMLKLEG